MINSINAGEVYGLMFVLLFNIGPLFSVYTIMSNKNSSNNSYGLWVCGILGAVVCIGLL